MTGTTDYVLVETRDRINCVKLNRPDKKNALTRGMYAAMTEALLNGEVDDGVRVHLIAGNGGCFTSGNDLADFLGGAALEEESPVMRFLRTVSQLKKPLLAAVDGLAVGVGVTLLLHCDLVYASESARFQMPFVNLGLCPEAGSTLLLPRLMGHQRAAELLLLGEQFSAARAQELGLVNQVCPDAELEALALDKARRLVSQPAAALRVTKALLKRETAGELQQVIGEEAGLFVERLRSPEAMEALRAFMERRAPDFSGFN